MRSLHVLTFSLICSSTDLLPGYGYARGGSDSAMELAAVAEAYFGEADRPDAGPMRRAALHLIDSRHPGLDSDIQAHR